MNKLERQLTELADLAAPIRKWMKKHFPHLQGAQIQIHKGSVLVSLLKEEHCVMIPCDKDDPMQWERVKIKGSKKPNWEAESHVMPGGYYVVEPTLDGKKYRLTIHDDTELLETEVNEVMKGDEPHMGSLKEMIQLAKVTEELLRQKDAASSKRWLKANTKWQLEQRKKK